MRIAVASPGPFHRTSEPEEDCRDGLDAAEVHCAQEQEVEGEKKKLIEVCMFEAVSIYDDVS